MSSRTRASTLPQSFRSGGSADLPADRHLRSWNAPTAQQLTARLGMG